MDEDKKARVESKMCNACKCVKELSLFYKNKTYTTGYEGVCKKCRSRQAQRRRNQRRRARLSSEIAYRTIESEFRNRDMSGEVWRDIPFATSYQASNLGRVRSKTRLSVDGKVLSSSIKRPSIHTSGYLRYTITVKGVNYSVYAHNLVASAFLGVKPEGYDVDHIDKIRINNNISNLRYITIKENRGQLFNKKAKKYECE